MLLFSQLTRQVITMSLAMLLFFTSALTNLAHADNDFIQRHDVQQFIQHMVMKYGFKKQSLYALFSAVKLRPQVIHHINKPLEKEAWKTYQALFITQSRIEHGVQFWNKYESALRKAEKIYGVPASIIVATIGIETKYGQNVGEYRVIDSLTNLAFSHTPRAAFFRQELEEFLLLTREQHLNPLKVMGSYAGAIGQPQFMPSSYRYYAVNFSNSGKTDLVYNEVDVIGSIANYYKLHGWIANEPIAVPAHFIGDRYRYLINSDKISRPLSISALAKYGIVPKKKLMPGLKVKVIALDSRSSKEYWLGFHNFDVIKRYNPNDLYAMAVYQLSYYIAALREQTNHG